MKATLMLRCTVVLLMASAAFAADVKIVEEIAVKVNGDIITQGDLLERERMVRQGIQQQDHLSGPALDAAVAQQTKDMLETMIDERLLVQKAKELVVRGSIHGEVEATERISIMNGAPDAMTAWRLNEDHSSFVEELVCQDRHAIVTLRIFLRGKIASDRGVDAQQRQQRSARSHRRRRTPCI